MDRRRSPPARARKLRPGVQPGRRPKLPEAPAALRRLWAPWRLEVVEKPRPPGCIFCQFPSATGEASDRANLIVHRSAHAFSILNRYPYNSGHVMVVPRAHVDRLDALPAEAAGELQSELARAVEAVRRAYRPEGMNLGMNLGKVAGAGIADHLHWHVVPRWGGDTNFMPVLSGTRVMIEHLDATWERLRSAFAS